MFEGSHHLFVGYACSISSIILRTLFVFLLIATLVIENQYMSPTVLRSANEVEWLCKQNVGRNMKLKQFLRIYRIIFSSVAD